VLSIRNLREILEGVKNVIGQGRREVGGLEALFLRFSTGEERHQRNTKGLA
jgi:hypothetical protein